MNRFVRCIDCGEGFMKTPFDQCPEYECDPNHPSEPFQVLKRDDFQEFLITHHGHRLEDVEIIENSFVSEKNYLEPVKTSYFKATNNKKEKFVIKRVREKIGEKVRYEIIPGDYFLECAGVKVQSEEITKQLEMEMMTHPFSEIKISAFLKLYKRIVRGIDTKNLERIFEESPHPLEEFYKMDDMSLFYLLRNCQNIFKGMEYSDIEEFIYHHKEDGVLLLKTRYKIQIRGKPETKEEAASTVIPEEVKKVIKRNDSYPPITGSVFTVGDREEYGNSRL
jgi:hypothetical protein